MLVLMTPSETKASKGRPTSTSARPSRKRTLLTKVKTFSRTMAEYVRVVGGGAELPSPWARRSAASASVRPVDGVSGSASAATFVLTRRLA